MTAKAIGLIWEIKKGDLVRLRCPDTQRMHNYIYERVSSLAK